MDAYISADLTLLTMFVEKFDLGELNKRHLVMSCFAFYFSIFESFCIF